MADLIRVMADLYASEVNCGIESFWDAGFSVWIGDDLNGRKAERTFRPAELGEVASWLQREANS